MRPSLSSTWSPHQAHTIAFTKWSKTYDLGKSENSFWEAHGPLQ